MHSADISLYQWFGIQQIMRQSCKYVQRNANGKVKQFIATISCIKFLKSTVIYSESENVWCYVRYMLKMCSFMLKGSLEIFFCLCEFSAIVTKRTEFYYFLIALGFIYSYFRLKRCF